MVTMCALWHWATPVIWLGGALAGLLFLYIAARLVFMAYFKSRNEFQPPSRGDRDGV